LAQPLHQAFVLYEQFVCLNTSPEIIADYRFMDFLLSYWAKNEASRKPISPCSWKRCP